MTVLSWQCSVCASWVRRGYWHGCTEYGQSFVFAEIDAGEFEEARKDPSLKALADAGSRHLNKLREEGRIR